MSLLLDTDVVSELLRPSPNPAVESWVAEHAAAELYFSTVGEAELRFGVAMLSEGQRKHVLATAIEGILREDFEDRILPFDSSAACAYANIAAAHRATGRTVASADCQIAAIAHSRGMTVATRNVRDFEDIGIEVVDPWAGA